MGTRADFYIGKGSKAEWLGSIAWDGMEWAEEKNSPLMKAATETEFRISVERILAKRDDATRPADGWPWPWKTSNTTDYTYYFYKEKSHYSYFDESIHWPEMDTSTMTLGKRSGVLVFTS
jgi:hypothetical protein